MQPRSSWQVTKSVWYALYMRDMLTRMFGNRYAWFWLFAEPMMFVGIMVSIRTFIRVMDDVAGAPMVPWMIIGLTAFFLFRDGMTSGMRAVKSSMGLFAYRQVKPVDTVFASAFVGLSIHAIVIALFLGVLALLGYEMMPKNFLLALFAWLSLWLMGLYSGLILSVATTAIPDLSKIVNVMTLPLMILSGAFFPVHFLPHEVQQWLLLNPILHAIEFLRFSFFENYWTFNEISMFYVYQWILPGLILGLLLHLRFENKLKAK